MERHPSDIATPIHQKFSCLRLHDVDAIADDAINLDSLPPGVEVHSRLISDTMYAKGYLSTFANSCLAEVNSRAKLHMEKEMPPPPRPPAHTTFNQRIAHIHSRHFNKMKPILSHYLVHPEQTLDVKRRKTITGKETTKTASVAPRTQQTRRLPTSKALFNLNASLLPPAAEFVKPKLPRRVSLLELAGVKPPPSGPSHTQFSFSSSTVPATLSSPPTVSSMLPPKRPTRIPSPHHHPTTILTPPAASQPTRIPLLSLTRLLSETPRIPRLALLLLAPSDASRIPRLSPTKPSLIPNTPSRLRKLSLVRNLSAPAAPAPSLPSLRLDRTLRKYTVPQETSLYARPTISSSNKSLRHVSK